MKRKFSKLLMVLTVCLMAFPCLTYAASSADPAPASHSSDKVSASSPPVNSPLYDNTISMSRASFTSDSFATPSGNSNDIRVWFDNQGGQTVTVTFYEKGLHTDKSLGSFDVPAGKNSSKIFEGSSDTTYHLGISSSMGAPLKGHLRARQLKSVDPLQPSNGDLYDNPNISSKSSFNSSEFGGTASTDIRVWFDNQGSVGVKVSLYKETKSGHKKMGSFSVSAGTNSSKDFSGSKGATYYIVIDTDSGGVVQGYLRARQL